MTSNAPRKMTPVEEQMRILMAGTEFGDEPTRVTMERELRADFANITAATEAETRTTLALSDVLAALPPPTAAEQTMRIVCLGKSSACASARPPHRNSRRCPPLTRSVEATISCPVFRR